MIGLTKPRREIIGEVFSGIVEQMRNNIKRFKISEYIIRDWQMEDAPSISRYANNRKIWLNLRDAFPHPYKIQDAEAFISRVLKTDPIAVYAIATKSEAIGSIGLMPGKDVHRYTAEMGYWLAEPYWGKGIMFQAVKSLADYAIHELKMHRIFAETYCTNPASAKVLETAGCLYEGILRSSAFKDNEFLDQYLYSYLGENSIHPRAPDTEGHAALGVIR